jgi:GR25 family glycosyltransferase involved in LPS biosynthesis
MIKLHLLLETAQVYVINLERNPERLEFIGQRLESLKIDFVRVDAVDGYALDKEYIEEFRESSKRPTGWKEGQIGCFCHTEKYGKKLLMVKLNMESF